MKNYRNQNGCWNCKLCFVHSQYDCEDDFFCTRNAPPRPKCGSVCMGEHYFKDMTTPDWDKMDRLGDEWDAWAEGRQVAAWGLCDCWETRK